MVRPHSFHLFLPLVNKNEKFTLSLLQCSHVYGNVIVFLMRVFWIPLDTVYWSSYLGGFKNIASDVLRSWKMESQKIKRRFTQTSHVHFTPWERQRDPSIARVMGRVFTAVTCWWTCCWRPSFPPPSKGCLRRKLNAFWVSNVLSTPGLIGYSKRINDSWGDCLRSDVLWYTNILVDGRECHHLACDMILRSEVL